MKKLASLAIAAVLALPVAASAAPRGAWIQEGFGPAGTSWNPAETELSSATAPSIEPLWRAPRPVFLTGTIDEDGSDPVVGGGHVYLQDDGKLSAFDADGCPNTVFRCRARWTTRNIGADGATPALTDDAVLIAGSTYLYSLDPDTGAQRWRAELGEPEDPHAGYDTTVAAGLAYVPTRDEVLVFDANGCGERECEPVFVVRVEEGRAEEEEAEFEEVRVAEDTLFVRTHFEGPDEHEDRVLAYKADGCDDEECVEPIWQTEDAEEYTDRFGVADGILFVARGSGQVSAFDSGGCGGAFECTRLWETEPVGFPQTGLALSDDLVVVGSHGHGIRVYDADGCGAAVCTPLWGTDEAGLRPTVAGDLVWTPTPGRTPEILLFPVNGCGRATCEPLARLSYGQARTQVEGAISVVDGHAYVHHATGMVVYGLPGS